MRITISPLPGLGRYGRFTHDSRETGFEVKLTETVIDGQKEKDFWLKAWRVRRNAGFIAEMISNCACGAGVLAVYLPAGISKEKLQELVHNIEASKPWEKEGD